MKINISQIKSVGFQDAAAFSAEVEKHIAALRRHQTTTGDAAPLAHALIEQLIRRVQYPIDAGKPDDFAADYEIVDDSPPLDDRKMALAGEVQRQAQVLMDTISPPLKRRLANIEVSRALAVEEKKRTPAHSATIAAHEARCKKLDAIHYHLATLEAEIHDLTEETIGQWQPKAFPA